MIDIKRMTGSELGRIAELDRSEHVTLAYSYAGEKLEAKEVDWQVPRWFEDDRGEHSVQAKVKAWAPLLEQGGTMYGAFDGRVLVGVVIFRPKLTGTMAQLAVLHVSKDYRRQGVASRLAKEAVRLAKEDGARYLYVSATPSESAVGFYRSNGFRLAGNPHPELYALEPEDIHMIKAL